MVKLLGYRCEFIWQYFEQTKTYLMENFYYEC